MILLLDVDGVITNWTESFLNCYRRAGGKVPEGFVHDRWDIHELLTDNGAINRAWQDPTLFRNMRLMYPEVIEDVRELNSNLSVSLNIVTSLPAMHIYPRWLWFREMMPFITYQQMFFCGDKTLVEGHMLVDDNISNLCSWLKYDTRKRYAACIETSWNAREINKLTQFEERVDVYPSLRYAMADWRKRKWLA